MDTFLTIIYGSKQTVFTVREIALLVGSRDAANFRSKLSYYVRTGKLIRLRRGVFAKDERYDPKELAVRICTPAYISFETVLAQEGVTFQYYDTIFVASYLSRTISVGKNTIAFRKLKDAILTDPNGLIDCGFYYEATRERAFLDRLYLSDSYHFDNLRGIDWGACRKLLPIYGSRKLEVAFETYENEYAQQK